MHPDCSPYGFILLTSTNTRVSLTPTNVVASNIPPLGSTSTTTRTFSPAVSSASSSADRTRWALCTSFKDRTEHLSLMSDPPSLTSLLMWRIVASAADTVLESDWGIEDSDSQMQKWDGMEAFSQVRSSGTLLKRDCPSVPKGGGE